MNKKPYISFDFDNTLYNPDTDSINAEIKEILDNYVKEGYKICITTLRSESETGRIKELFPDIEIFPTGGFNKTIALKKYIPVPVIKHYDDDLGICISLSRWSKIQPIWVRNKKMLSYIKNLDTIDLK